MDSDQDQVNPFEEEDQVGSFEVQTTYDDGVASAAVADDMGVSRSRIATIDILEASVEELQAH
jgi:hypothetical protein